MPVRLLWFLKPSVSGGLCGQNTKQSSSRRWRCKCISESRLAPTPGDPAGSTFSLPLLPWSSAFWQSLGNTQGGGRQAGAGGLCDLGEGVMITIT